MAFLTNDLIVRRYPDLIFGDGCQIDERAVLIGKGITLGDNVRIDCDAKLLAAGDGAMVRIGSHCHIATDAILMGSGGIAIHDHCCVGMGSKLVSATDDFAGRHLVGPQYRGEPGYTNVYKQKITMLSFAIVTTHCLLLPGATMDEGAVLGAGSVISRNAKVKGWWIHAGHPLKSIRERSNALVTVAAQWEEVWRRNHAAKS